jgi:integrase
MYSQTSLVVKASRLKGVTPMARTTKELSAIEVDKAKPGTKQKNLFDGKGLFLLIPPQKFFQDGRPQPASKWWRFKYTFDGKSKTLSFGTYPEISLAQAREKREEARKLIAVGIDPAINRKAVKTAKDEALANSFEAIAREWHGHRKPEWSPDHAATILTRMEKDIFPWIGGKPLTDVTAKDIKSVLDRVKSRGTMEAARRLQTITGQVYTYAISTDRANFNIAAGLKGYLPPSSKTKKHMAAVTDPKALAPLLRAIDVYQGGFIAQCALKLLPLIFCRPGELRHAEWSEFDFEAEQWNIPGPKMKMKAPHIVPLSAQAIAILKELHPLTGNGKYVFPSTRSTVRCMSDNTINAAFRRMGFDGETITGHGFRATARTLLDEVLGFRPEVIEMQLAHGVRDPLGRAYNRTGFLAERKKMMQTWADYLDKLKSGAKVIQLPDRSSK